MATRFYLPSSGAAGVSPTISATDWAHINTDRRKMSPIKANSSFAATVYAPDAADHITAAKSHFVQFVSDVLAPQTIAAQTVSLAMLNLESNAGNNCFLNWKVYAVPVDGSSVLGTLVALRADATEMGTTQINRTDSVTSTQYIGATAFRLVFEIGIGGTPVAAGGVQGHNGTIRFGDPTGGADLAANDTATTDLAPWLDFATTTMIFQIPVALAGTQAQSGSSTATLITTINSTVSLIQGTTVIASWADNDISTSFQTFEHTLTGAEANAITDYSDLRVRFSATGNATWEEVSWAEMQLPLAPSGTVTNVDLSGTQVQAGTSVHSVGHPCAGTQAQAGTRVKAVVHLTAGTQAQSNSVKRALTRTSAGTQAQSGSLVKIATKLVSLAGTQAQSSSATHRVNRLASGTQAQAGSNLRSVAHRVSGTQAQVGSQTHISNYSRVGTQAQAGTISKSIAHRLAGTQAQSGSVTATFQAGAAQTPVAVSGTQVQAGTSARVVSHALSGTQIQASSIARSVVHKASGTQAQVGTQVHSTSHVRAGTQAQSGSAVKVVAHLIAVSGTQAQAGTQAKSIKHLLSVLQGQGGTTSHRVNAVYMGSQAQPGASQRFVTHAVAGVQAQAGTITRTAAHLIALGGTQAQSATATHSTTRTLAGAQAQAGVVTLTIPYLVSLSGTQTQAGSVTLLTPRTVSLSGTQAQAGAGSRQLSKARAVTQAQAGTSLRIIPRALVGTQTQVGSASKRINRAASVNQGQLATIIKGLAYKVARLGTQPQTANITASPTYSINLVTTQAQLATVIPLLSKSLIGTQRQAGSIAATHYINLSRNQPQLGRTTRGIPYLFTTIQPQLGFCTPLTGVLLPPVLKYYGQISCPVSIAERLFCPQEILGSIACPVDIQEKLECPQEFLGNIACTLDIRTRIGVGPLAKPLANSTNQFQITLVENGLRVIDAAITLTVYAPDGITKTLDAATVSHTGNGVYSIKTATTVVPKKGPNYQAIFHITRGPDEYNPKYYFEVYES